MAVVDVRFWDDLSPEQRVALMTEIEESLISQAKSDIPANDVDIRPARPTLDVTMAVGVTANTWILAAPTGPGTWDNIVNWTLGAQQNAALVMMTNPFGSVIRVRVSNATTVLAIIELSHSKTYQANGGQFDPAGVAESPRIGSKAYFRQVFLFKKTETMILDVQMDAYAAALGNVPAPFYILLAEPAGTTVGCKA